MAKSPEEYAHVEWLGYVQPVGLVVSVPAMLEAQCYINKNITGEHKRFLECLPLDKKGEILPEIQDFAAFTRNCLGWEEQDLVDVPQRGELPDNMSALEVILPQYKETLRPNFAVPVLKPKEGQNPWQMLVQVLPSQANFDEPSEADSSRHWNAAPQLKFERLLRETQVPMGLLCNGSQLRLVYAPKGESSGYATFNVAEMVQVAGRPMFAALHMLLSVDRMFTLGDNQRLPYILENSRKYQNTVSTKLAEQVMSALFELLRGFQAADDQRKGELLREVLANNPQHVYHGLLTVLMRMVFVLYAEDRNLMSSDPVYSNFYSVNGLFERLRADAGQHPDTMDQRFGAWSQLLTLFRLIYEGGQHADFKLPARKGYLFDPNRYPFLEGRYDDGNSQENSSLEMDSTIQIPRISDGVIYRVLEDLSILDGERLSYRTLDVEQVGSVYETIMGFELQLAQGKSIAIKPAKSHGAPTTINLDALLSAKPSERAGLLKQWSDQTLGATDAAALKSADKIEDVLAALDKKIAKHVTPSLVPAKSMVFQPSDERRRSGSHYTPRSLTEPIVHTTLEPILKRLCDPEVELPKLYEPSQDDKQRYTKGELEARIRHSERAVEYAIAARERRIPHPNQILDLKICDPAMGSGAFLVEVCRQLGDELIKSWYAHDMVPNDIPPDEDETLYARRTVAQRCLYGVDKNIMAVDLAKLSLWLVTLAKDHPFTFLDHSLRHGDSLVGLTRHQIIRFDWEPKKQMRLGEDLIQKRLDRATEARAKILNAREDTAYRDQEQRMEVANEALNLIRLLGNACVSCFFAADKKKAREQELERVYGFASSYLSSLTTNNQSLTTSPDFESRDALQAAADRLNAGPHPVPCFHWEIEFPEVFSRENGGFDAFVGNPPFLGGSQLSALTGGPTYQEWLKECHARAFGNADLSAYFFRRAWEIICYQGSLGFLATKSISEGGTRTTGLQAILALGGIVFNATRSKRWPGEASVLVSVVHIRKSQLGYSETPILDGKPVKAINSRLHPAVELPDPVPLAANEQRGFFGTKVGSIGFVLEPDEHESLSKQPSNRECIRSYLGGEEVNTSPTQSPHRYAIYFGANPLEYAERFPDLLAIVRQRVKPERDKALEHGPGKHGKKFWWQYTLRADPLYRAIENYSQCLVTAITTSHLAFTFQPIRQVFTHSLVVCAFDAHGPFACLQSQVHYVWAKLLSSSLGMTLRYSVSDAFHTFPFPSEFEGNSTLKKVGQRYYDYRRELMVKNQEGLTASYNRFHDPGETSPKFQELRELHDEMDRAVLQSYGWDDLAEQAICNFILDYEEDEDDDPSVTRSRKKKPWRYRWSDEFCDEVLARLLQLNAELAMQEKLAGKKAEVKCKKSVGSNRRGRKTYEIKQDPGLFNE
jgi:hypothetical protein